MSYLLPPIFFVVGFFEILLATCDTILTAQRRAVPASNITAASIVLGWIVVWTVVTNTDNVWLLFFIALANALGGWIGSYVGINHLEKFRLPWRRKEKR